MKIEIITTPNGALRETGFGGEKACLGVLGAMERLGYEAVLISCENRNDLEEVVKRCPDFVVLAVKYIPMLGEEDIWLSEYFSDYGIEHSGSTRSALEFDSNKILAKQELSKKGVRTAKYFSVIPGEYDCEDELPLELPLFLKPSSAANGNGIDDKSLVNTFDDFVRKIDELYLEFCQPLLAEEFLSGREFTVSVIQGEREVLVSGIEIVPAINSFGVRMLGRQEKLNNDEVLLQVKPNGDLLSRIEKMAIESFNGLGARDFGRIDIKLDVEGECYFMEANLVPGVNPGSSYFPLACELKSSLAYDEVIEKMLESGLSRIAYKKFMKDSYNIYNN